MIANYFGKKIFSFAQLNVSKLKARGTYAHTMKWFIIDAYVKLVIS